MTKRVQCLLLVESSERQRTRSSKRHSGSSARAYALLPQIFRATCPEVLNFFKINGIQVVDSHTSRTDVYSTVNTKKMDILVAELTYTNVRSNIRNLLIVVHEYDRELTRLLFSRSVDQIRSMSNYKEFFSSSAILEDNVWFIQGCLSRGVEFSHRHHYGGTVLHFAVQGSSLTLVKSFLKHGCAVDAANSSRWTPLHFAAHSGNFKIVKTLVEHGANVNARTEWGENDSAVGCTPLLLAAESGHLNVVKFLLKKGADINVVNHFYCQALGNFGPNESNHTVTPLHLAAWEGHFQVVDLLMQHAARIDVRAEADCFKCLSPLMAAAEKGHSKIVKLLLEHGADIHGVHHVESPDGMTALHFAAEYGHLETAKILLKEGASINARTKAGFTPLLLAAHMKRTEVVKLFLEAGADINAVYNAVSEERSILHIALLQKNQELFDLVLSHRSNLNNDLILRAFHLALSDLNDFCLKNTNLLIPPPFTLDIESLQNIDETKLFFGAIHKCRLDIAEQLLIKGVDVNSFYELCHSKFEKTPPLHWATLVSEESMIQLLLNHGAEIDLLDDKGRSPVFYAVERNEIDILKCLIKNKASIHNDCSLMFKAILVAKRSSNLDIAEFLLQNGADPNSQMLSVTPTALAVKQDNLQLLKLLLNFGATQVCRAAVDDAHTNCSLLQLGFSLKRVEIFRFLMDYSFHDLDSFRSIQSIILYTGYCDSASSLFKLNIIKMMSAGISMRGIALEDLCISEETDFQNRCKAEILMLQSERVEGTNVYFYNILMKNIDQVAAYARNTRVVQALGTGNYKDRFPIYGKAIECQFEKGCHRRDLLIQGIRIYSSLIKKFSTLPDELKEKIVDLLNNRELQMLHCI